MKLRHAIAVVATCSAMVIGTSGVSGAVTPNRISDLHCSGGTITVDSTDFSNCSGYGIRQGASVLIPMGFLAFYLITLAIVVATR